MENCFGILIPSPQTDGRIIVALDDFINPKVGRNIFGCETIFDHAAKANQSNYPWAQNVVAVGLLKKSQRAVGMPVFRFSFLSAKKDD